MKELSGGKKGYTTYLTAQSMETLFDNTQGISHTLSWYTRTSFREPKQFHTPTRKPFPFKQRSRNFRVQNKQIRSMECGHKGNSELRGPVTTKSSLNRRGNRAYFLNSGTTDFGALIVGTQGVNKTWRFGHTH